MASNSGYAIYEHDAFLGVNFLKANFHNFRVAGLDRPANERRLDGQLAMPAVNQDAQADSPGTAEIEETVHGGANRPASVKDVVHDHQVAVVHREIDLRGVDYWLRADSGKIVPVERDIEDPHGNIHVCEAVDDLCQPLRERNAPAANTNQSEIFRPTALLDKFVSQPLESAVDFLGGEQLPFFYDAHLAAHPNIDGGRFAAAESAARDIHSGVNRTLLTCGTLNFGEFARIGTPS
jgi:hypothetical protein